MSNRNRNGSGALGAAGFLAVLIIIAVSVVFALTASCDTLSRYMRSYELPARCTKGAPTLVVPVAR